MSGRDLDAAAATVVLPGPGAAADRATADSATVVLGPAAAAAMADPEAPTQVVHRGGPAGLEVATAGAPTAPGADQPSVSRRRAAELGLYTGAALVLVAVLGAVVRGWSDWEPTMRWASVALASVALLAAGVFVRLPWSRRPGEERRRAVSAMLTSGAALAVAALGVALGVGQGNDPRLAVVHSIVACLSMLTVAMVARTPMSETGLLAALTWSAWVLVPPGELLWAVLALLGLAWALVGSRYARGRRTASVAGATLALAASVGLAQGPWAWPVRAVLAALTAFGLAAFLRGWANHWLALGAGAATALAASVAGGALSPALALLVGGLATMAVSGIALRGAGRG